MTKTDTAKMNHHHHRCAQRSAGASRRCDRSPERFASASSRASVAYTPVSRQIWWTQVVDGRPQVRLHSCEGRSPSLVLAQIRRIEFARTSLRSLATWPKRSSLRLRTMYETSTGRYVTKLRRWTRSRPSWCAGRVVGNVDGRNPVFSNRLVWGSRSQWINNEYCIKNCT